MKRRIAIVVAAVLLAVPLLASCTPEQVAAYVRYVNSPSADCYQAINKHWGGDKAWARKIMLRESGNNPRAQNARSSAAGCFQMLALHAHRFNAVGCSWAQRYDPDCNVKAAYHLYREAGQSPWRLTNY